MKNTLSNVVIFTAGLAIGSVVSWQLLKSKYEKISHDEIESVREYYSRKNKVDIPKEEPEAEEEVVEQVSSEEYATITERFGYTNYSDIPKSTEKEDASVDRPYVISPEEYGELEDYEQIELTYYEDGVLTDDQNEPIEDVDDIVGLDSLNTFGKYEDDSVHVRNDSRKCDYEILRDVRNFADLKNKHPHRMDV